MRTFFLTLGRVGYSPLLILMLVSFTALSPSAVAQYTPASWPAAFVDYADSTGNPIQDASDQTPSTIDLVYSVSTPASVGVAFDGSTAFFRMQLLANPWRSNNTWAPYAWVIAFSGATGQGEPIGHVSVSASGSSMDVTIRDATNTDLIYSYAKANATPGAVRSVAAGTSGNFYLDFQVPMAALNSRLGIDEHTHLRLFYGTSASGGTINKDYMTGSAVDFLGLTTTNFDGIFHGGLTPQPVELVSFSARMKDGSAVLNWRTATELNNFGFEIQREEARTGWSPVGFVTGAGTVHSPRRYSFVDHNPPNSGTLRYRLRQLDRDGRYEFSPVVELRNDSRPLRNTLATFPSPARGVMTVNYTLDVGGTVDLILYDSGGRRMRTLHQAVVQEAGVQSAVLDVAGLPRGTYMLQLRSAAGTDIHPVMIMH